MSIHELAKKLVEEYGAIVRTEHHMQIHSGPGYHDIWHGKEGLKWKLQGMRKVDCGSPERLLAALLVYQSESTDLARMQRLVAFLRRIEGKTGIFVDAGWRNGKAKAAMVWIRDDGATDIMIRQFDAETSEAAEIKAIDLANARWSEGYHPIHSDCQRAVEKYGRPAVWIPRESNKEADKLGNMRSQ